MAEFIKLNHGYSLNKNVYDDPTIAVEDAKVALCDVDFDTIVGSGISGAIVIPMIAVAMNKKFVLIRKPGASAHTADHVGTLGNRWVFIDDFISSGTTRNKVKLAVAEIVQMRGRTDFTTQFVGTWEYDRTYRSDLGFTPSYDPPITYVRWR